MRSDPCIVEFPKHVTAVCPSASGFLNHGEDTIALGDGDPEDLDAVEGCLCHRRCKVGLPTTDEEIGLIWSSLNGDERPFCSTSFDDNTPASVAHRMTSVTKCVCQVTKNEDGIWVGDCEDCCKRLGRGCCGAAWVRSRHGQVKPSLEEKRKVPLPLTKGAKSVFSNKGHMHRSHKSGPSGRKVKCVRPMKDCFPSFLRTLDRKERIALVRELNLIREFMPTEDDVDDEVKNRSKINSMSDGALLSLLIEFSKTLLHSG